MEPLNEHEELKRIAPTLHNLPQADPFVVPEGLFDRFPHQVQAAIAGQTGVPQGSGLWWRRLAIALPLVAILGAGLWLLSRGKPVPEVETMAVIPLSDEELDQLDEPELLQAFDEAEASSADGLGDLDMDLNEDELLAYLENENADIPGLITELE